ncbi:MAG: peptidogalycan biosysnthesis protein, partial [Pseudomonadota bacterium]
MANPQPKETPVEVRVLTSLAEIAPEVWDACAAPEGSARPMDPFTTHRFLKALEDSRSVGVGTGWEPHYLEARVDGETVGVAQLYAKNHSQGEYIFDHN